MKRWFFRFALMISAAWLLAALAFVFDGSDPEDEVFRTEAGSYHSMVVLFWGSGPKPSILDLPGTFDYYSLQGMSRFYAMIADLRGEPLASHRRKPDKKQQQTPPSEYQGMGR